MPHLNIGILCEPMLKVDGSNFAVWYKRLRNVLWVNKLLYMLEEPLGDKTENSASKDENDEYHTCHDMDAAVQRTML